MKQVKWFNRKFDFSFEQNIFPSIIDRIEGSLIRLDHKIRHISSDKLIMKLDEGWSIQENIGHLYDLEPLWQGRLEDILNGEKFMRPADLENRDTDKANHNSREINSLMNDFRVRRQKIVKSLKELNENEIYQFALHPRLNKPMRIMDLFLFVAEHDDHHLVRINELNTLLASSSKTY